jgi:transcriptional regulator with XRE-family HTH domain
MKGNEDNAWQRKQVFDQEGNDRYAVRLRELRKKAGFTQQQLAFESGLTQPHIARLEKGKANPTISVICVIARTMEIDPEEFFKFKLSPKDS